ncbi:hypothetical protein BsWGS_00336 [Bradybaena similaris]
MTAVHDKILLLLSESPSTLVNTTKALCWSFDNRIVVCCAEKLLILNMVTNADLKSNRAEAFRIRIDETPDISSLDTFSFASGLLNFKQSLYSISAGERHVLSLDPSLTQDCLYPNPRHATFKHAVCSPMCLTLDRPYSLIAAVTFGHRVVIFTEAPEGWKLMLDCSPIIKDHTVSEMNWPVTLGKSMKLSTYIDLVHSMCTVELEWSSVFSSSGSSHQSFLLLFTGTKSGTITVWKMCLPFETKDDFTFQCTDQYKSEVTAMSWHSKQKDQGLVSVGYGNGSVRILSVCVNPGLPISCIEVSETFSDLLADGLAISDFAWVVIDKVTTVLICCKQYFLSLYSLCGDTIRLVDHHHLDVGLPLTSVSTFGACGFTASKDGDLIQFELKQESGHISLDWSAVPITCLPFGSELPRFCFGVALTPNCGLCLSVHRSTHHAKILDLRKKFATNQMITLSIPFNLTLKSVMEALSRSSPNSPQEVMINLRLHIQQRMQMNSSLGDIMEIYAELNKKDDVQSLQVARDMLLFLDQSSAFKFAYQKELEWVGSTHETITERLMIRHIEACFQNVSSSPTSNELSIIKAMMSWMSTRNVTSNVSDLHLASLEKVCQKSTNSVCVICGSEFMLSSFFLAKCIRGHQTRLCALTLLPCQDMSGRKCEACAHPSVGLSALSDVKMIPVKWLCVLCGGYLRNSIL